MPPTHPAAPATLAGPDARATRLALTGVIVTVTIWGGNVVLLKTLLSHLNAESINTGRFLLASAVLSTLKLTLRDSGKAPESLHSRFNVLPLLRAPRGLSKR
ncbi:hypothetical protein [Deinococcus knuensis]|uniref:EamA domain-containing protein n=1 Tax=Deinococcus knuensis TaxID=1837380 RepID=A0ABQ2SAR3_9DEIO|nr:hypothetical protein [Deinococcus knuensis]GGS15192.1 hypothetical protein GCM10008961_03170 [Deinococcus knuensis]